MLSSIYFTQIDERNKSIFGLRDPEGKQEVKTLMILLMIQKLMIILHHMKKKASHLELER